MRLREQQSLSEDLATQTEHRPSRVKAVSSGDAILSGRAASTLGRQADPFAVIIDDGQHLKRRRKTIAEDNGWRWISGLQQNLTNATIVVVMRSVLVRSILLRRVSAVERAGMV